MADNTPEQNDTVENDQNDPTRFVDNGWQPVTLDDIKAAQAKVQAEQEEALKKNSSDITEADNNDNTSSVSW